MGLTINPDECGMNLMGKPSMVEIEELTECTKKLTIRREKGNVRVETSMEGIKGNMSTKPSMCEVESLTVDIKGLSVTQYEQGGNQVVKGTVEDLVTRVEDLRLGDGDNVGMDELKGTGGKRVTTGYLKGLRHQKWEDKMGWGHTVDLDTQLDSKEALPEMLQNYEEKMVLIGGDVVSLYPNLEIESMVEKVKEAILTSSMKWEEVDYIQGVPESCLRSDVLTITLKPIICGKSFTPLFFST